MLAKCSDQADGAKDLPKSLVRLAADATMKSKESDKCWRNIGTQPIVFGTPLACL